MEFTVKVPEKLIKDAIDSSLSNKIYNYYSDTVRKKAKVPSSKKLIAEAMADDEFMAEIQKRLIRYTNAKVEDCFYEFVDDLIEDDEEESKLRINIYRDACQNAEEEQCQQVAKASQEAEIKYHTDILNKAGYQVTKKT